MRRIILTILMMYLATSHSAFAQDYQLLPANCVQDMQALMGESVFSRGMGIFLKDIFNLPAYAQEFLPNNFYHLIELLHYGNRTNKDYIYVRSVLRLFTNKLKASSYLNAYAFSDALGQLPGLLDPYCRVDINTEIVSLQDIIYQIQYQTFASQFPEFTAHPEEFLRRLSAQIEDVTELRRLILNFLEISISRLIWSASDQIETWNNTQLIAHQLEQLYKNNIIANIEDLNDLYISLLERYCYFLDVASSTIDIKTYEMIKNDVQTNQHQWLILEEQEIYLESKMDRLTRALVELEAKARAREIGMII